MASTMDRPGCDEGVSRNSLVPCRIVVLHQRRLSREAFRKLLETCALDVIADGTTLDDALERSTAAADPNLIVHCIGSGDDLDRAYPAILEARQRFPGARSILLAPFDRRELLVTLIRQGIEAVVSPDASWQMLRRTLELVLLGQRVIPAELGDRLFALAQTVQAPATQPNPPPMDLPQSMAAVPAPPAPVSERLPPAENQQHGTSAPGTCLSPREHEILRCLVDGLSNKAIARELCITEATVKVHVKALLRKTRMNNRTQAAIWALTHGINLGLPGMAEPDNAPASLPAPVVQVRSSREWRAVAVAD